MVDGRIYVAGHRGMVGSALLRYLTKCGYPMPITRTSSELDLTDQISVNKFFASEKPAYVYLAAAKVGGIRANDTYPAEFIYENLIIEANVIHAAYLYGVRRLLFLGSSCIYPRLAAQPMAEEALLTGPLEPTNEPYAIAKISGIKLCESYNRQYGTDYRSVMPTNLYGPGDNFDLQNSHVVPALIGRFHAAKENDAPTVEVWGTGRPRRELLHVDDMAAACIHVMELDKMIWQEHTQPRRKHLNVGTGEDVSIRQLACMVRSVVGYKGAIRFDSSKPDGAPRKMLDVSRINASGWQSQIGLREGLIQTYRWFLENRDQVRC